MFNLGFSEILLLGLIALIFIGPNQLPEVARTIGRLMNEFKRATSDFQDTITTQITDEVQQRRIDSVNSSTDYQSAEEFSKSISVPGANHESGAQNSELPVGAQPVSKDPGDRKS